MITFQQLKAAAAAIVDKYHISEDDARRIIGQYNKDNNPALSDVVAGDLSSVPAVAASLGISCDSGKIKPVKDHKRKNKTIPAAIDTAPVIDNAPCDSTTAKDHAVLETVAGEIVPDNCGLPDGLTDMIYSAVDSFCRKHDFENMSKCRQTAWGACCQFIGQTIFKQNRKILAGTPPKTGGFCYDTDKLSALADIWCHMCGVYGKAPFIFDFANFAGMDNTALYANSGKYLDMENVTPARVRLIQKLHEMQEKGIAGLIVDGRQNPTGALAALNHWHGWTQTREIIHTTSAPTASLDDIPKLGDNNPDLPRLG